MLTNNHNPSPKIDDARWDIMEKIFIIGHMAALIAAAAENKESAPPTASIAWVAGYMQVLCEDAAEMVEMS